MFLKLKIGLHVDSGINRLGIKTKELKYQKFKGLEIVLLLSHLASSDKKNSSSKINLILIKKVGKIILGLTFNELKIKKFIHKELIY